MEVEKSYSDEVDNQNLNKEFYLNQYKDELNDMIIEYSNGLFTEFKS